jgi:hypothetical protein
MQRNKKRRFGRTSPGKILQTIVDAVEEPFARGSLTDFVQAAGADVSAQLEFCIRRMNELHKMCQADPGY